MNVAEQRHVGLGTIGEPGNDRQPGRFAGPGEVQLPRADRDPLGHGARRVATSPGGDPGADDAIFPRARREPLASFVRNLAGRLQQHEAPVGLDHVHTAAHPLADDRVIVVARVVAEEAEVQPAPTLERAVTGPGVAAQPAEEARDVAVEVDLQRDLLRSAIAPVPRPASPAKVSEPASHASSPIIVRMPRGIALSLSGFEMRDS